METQEEFGLEDIIYKRKTLAEWQERFTLILPELPSTNHEVQKFLAKVNNAYHLVYNQYNELLVTCSKNDKDLSEMKQVIINAICLEYKTQGVTRMPARETLSEMALIKNDEIKSLNSEKLLYELIKDFFENHRIKLEKIMYLAGNLAYLVNGSDKTHYRSGDPVI